MSLRNRVLATLHNSIRLAGNGSSTRLVDGTKQEPTEIVREAKEYLSQYQRALEPEISRTLRKLPPVDYLFQIKSFSLFSVTEENRFESGDFESGGYKWKLCLYPNGDEKRNEKDHISLYLAILATDTLPLDADGRVRHFHRFKTEFGFAKLLSLDTFKDASNGYLIDESCVFGAEMRLGSGTRAKYGVILRQFLLQISDTSKCFIVEDSLVVEAQIHFMSDVTDFS
ncbi:unnamed protein product [Ilex paraguariensis]|uniref:MATH domain-containing protein n=1 Tax=Ilex paraguariensis TaxID=185542 RepID=A0ABC8RRX8_9AQUA